MYLTAVNSDLYSWSYGRKSDVRVGAIVGASSHNRPAGKYCKRPATNYHKRTAGRYDKRTARKFEVDTSA